MKFELCKSCGAPYDVEEVNDGYCLECAPDAAVVLSLEEPPKVDWNALGDCE